MRVLESLLLVTAAALFGCGDGSGDGDAGIGGNRDGGGGINEFLDGDVPASCKKVDLVFSVDPSGSMSEELGAMSNDVFPAFANALRNVGGGLEDYRVGVIEACPDPASFHTRGENTGACNFESGEVWMTSASSALVDEFSCVGDIYRTNNCSGDNDDEQPASAAIAALTDPYISNENAGFLRSDALLVVVAITDEDEQPAPVNKSAQELYNEFVAIKGSVKRMVLLGIGGGPGGCSSGTYGSAQEATKLRALTDLFIAQERGVFWDLCQGSLEDGLTDAMTVIEQACEEFPPIK